VFGLGKEGLDLGARRGDRVSGSSVSTRTDSDGDERDQANHRRLQTHE
jgi:hypothetical protein